MYISDPTELKPGCLYLVRDSGCFHTLIFIALESGELANYEAEQFISADKDQWGFFEVFAFPFDFPTPPIETSTMSEEF